MSNYFANLEPNLGRAAIAMGLAIVSAAGIELASGQYGIASGASFLFVLVAMPAIAWFISRAAKEIGRAHV